MAELSAGPVAVEDGRSVVAGQPAIAATRIFSGVLSFLMSATNSRR
jgi:hypothetical protein